MSAISQKTYKARCTLKNAFFCVIGHLKKIASLFVQITLNNREFDLT